ncbi:hypothetical protein CBR_g31850 [Chara braunii]|uniref:Uncharacterized protein n=1 Tax=Chara braunii TaxID=69332 RepID=A0A388LFU0_CHABU|nr:hypothetical protein CBR_g31850 [Chara braunii]|eukprot:GBG81174.1 hypothetical protein CBR_g31850 [Chara braunii]
MVHRAVRYDYTYVGAGDGLLCFHLNKSINRLRGISSQDEGVVVDIVATDSNERFAGPDAKNPCHVEDAEQAIVSRCPDIVICSWQPMGVDWTARMRQTPSVREYILIGEMDDGICGHSWLTWGYGGFDSSADDTSSEEAGMDTEGNKEKRREEEGNSGRESSTDQGDKGKASAWANVDWKGSYGKERKEEESRDERANINDAANSLAEECTANLKTSEADELEMLAGWFETQEGFRYEGADRSKRPSAEELGEKRQYENMAESYNNDARADVETGHDSFVMPMKKLCKRDHGPGSTDGGVPPAVNSRSRDLEGQRLARLETAEGNPKGLEAAPGGLEGVPDGSESAAGDPGDSECGPEDAEGAEGAAECPGGEEAVQGGVRGGVRGGGRDGGVEGGRLIESVFHFRSSSSKAKSQASTRRLGEDSRKGTPAQKRTTSNDSALDDELYGQERTIRQSRNSTSFSSIIRDAPAHKRVVVAATAVHPEIGERVKPQSASIMSPPGLVQSPKSQRFRPSSHLDPDRSSSGRSANTSSFGTELQGIGRLAGESSKVGTLAAKSSTFGRFAVESPEVQKNSALKDELACCLDDGLVGGSSPARTLLERRRKTKVREAAPYIRDGWERVELLHIGRTQICRTDERWSCRRHSHTVSFRRPMKYTPNP